MKKRHVPARPTAAEYAAFYAPYVLHVRTDDIVKTLEEQAVTLRQTFAAVPPEQETFRYGPGKWSVREVVAHMADTERVFGYRAFAISRGELQPLPGFDQNTYIANSGAADVPLKVLVASFVMARAANTVMYDTLTPEAWTRGGVANGQPVSVRALAYISAGHVIHHLAVLRKRYGIG